MKFLYGLILALIFFEGFIRQCEGAGRSKGARAGANIEDLPMDVIEKILLKTGFDGTKNIAQANLTCLDAVKKMIEGYIFHILPMSDYNGTMTKYDLDGNTYLKINGLKKIQIIFKNFGESIKKIKIDHTVNDVKDYTSRQTYENVIADGAEHFTELEIVTKRSFLDELSIDGMIIQFPNVKKLVYRGPKFGNSHDLNSIFPSLENLTLYRTDNYMDPLHLVMKINMTCLANVRKLKELKLEVDSRSYQLDELENIFKKNKQLSTIGIVFGKRIDILWSIEKYVKTVQTLDIVVPSLNYEGLHQVPKNHSFNMTNLKRLNIRALQNGFKVINLINSFKNIEVLDAMVLNHLIILKIERLIEIKELIMYRVDVAYLGDVLERFGEKKQLDTIRCVLLEQNRREVYEPRVIRINKKLKQSHKPTWKMAFSEYEGRYTMTLTRDKKQ